MKTYIVPLLLLIPVSLFVQEKTTVNKAILKPTTKTKVYLPKRVPADTLDPAEFNDYDGYIKKRDSITIARAVTNFKKRLIAIDRLIARHQIDLLNRSQLSISINMSKDSIINSIEITFDYTEIDKITRYKERPFFESYIRELNLIHLQYVLHKAKKVEYFEPRHNYIKAQINDVVESIKTSSNGNQTVYANLLLQHIHQKLKEHKDELNITNEHIYETEYEPSGLTLANKIKNREKFIRYINSKINA